MFACFRIRQLKAGFEEAKLALPLTDAFRLKEDFRFPNLFQGFGGSRTTSLIDMRQRRKNQLKIFREFYAQPLADIGKRLYA